VRIAKVANPSPTEQHNQVVRLRWFPTDSPAPSAPLDDAKKRARRYLSLDFYSVVKLPVMGEQAAAFAPSGFQRCE
jgi:hypothetical protein